MALGPAFAAVLDGARTGAEWAWTELYRDLAPSVLGYLRSRGAPDPEDTTGEVFLHLVRSLHTFEGDEDGFRSFVFVIVHRRLQDEQRRLARHPVDPAPPSDVDRAGGDAESDAITSIATDEALAALARLTPDQRDVLTLRLIADLSLEQTAAVLAKSIDSTKQLQRRGLERLRKLLAQEAVTS